MTRTLISRHLPTGRGDQRRVAAVCRRRSRTGPAGAALDWRIPAGGAADALAALERLYGPRSESIDRANAEVLRRLDEGAPMLVDIQTAGDVIPRLAGRTLLHCGPAIDWDAVCDPLRRSMRAATVAEGWATDVEHADRLLADGDVQLAPATDHATVVPMATAMGPSTPVFVVDNHEAGTRAYAPINQGPGETAWFGRETAAAIGRLEFLRDLVGPLLREVLARSGPIDDASPGRQGVQIGDDIHMHARHDQPVDPQPAAAPVSRYPMRDARRAKPLSVRQPHVLPQSGDGAARSLIHVGRAGCRIQHRHDDVP
jgi:hypothetical protein